ncbi:MAG: helix-turn-helix transcriptional regulator [Bilophila sp.]
MTASEVRATPPLDSEANAASQRESDLSAVTVQPGWARVLALAAGFSFSAGWDCFPSMYTLWLSDFFYFDGPSDSIGQLGSLSSFVLVKALILFVMGIALERTVFAFLLRQGADLASPPSPWYWLARQARSVLFPRVSSSSLSPKIRARLYIMLPFALVQATAFVLILILTFFLPVSMLDTIPLLVGLISALLGLLWFSLLTVLPAVWCCLAYGLALLCSLGLHQISTLLPAEGLPWLRVLCPLLALPLLFVALPPAPSIREHAERYRLRRVTSLSQPARPMPFMERIAGTPFPLVGLYLFTLMYGLQLLLGFASGPSFANNMPLALGCQTDIVFASQAMGAFLTAWLTLHQKGHTLLIPLLGLALFGAGALIVSLVNGRGILIPSLLLHVAAGGCAAFGISLLGAFFQSGSHVFRTVASSLFILNIVGYFGGYGLWNLTRWIQNGTFPSYDLYMQLLALLSLGGMLSVYTLRQSIGDMVGDSEWQPETETELGFDPALLLTKREREVAGLVQQGMKNLEISVRMNITESTLRVHLRHVYKKLGIQGRSALRDISIDDYPSEK